LLDIFAGCKHRFSPLHIHINDLSCLSKFSPAYFTPFVYPTISLSLPHAQALIKSSIEIYELMGMQTLDAYVQDFETQLLEATRYVLHCVVDLWC